MAFKNSPQSVHATLKKHIIGDGYDLVYDLKKSHGFYMHDSRTGKDFLDIFSFFATMPLRYNHPKLLEKDFLEKMAYIATTNPSNADIYTVEYADFVDSFARLATRGHFKHHFFIAGGSAGVENAIKAAMDWKVQKAGLGPDPSTISHLDAPHKDVTDMQIIHFRNAFHGRTGYCMSMTATFDPKKYLYFPKFNWPRITSPAVQFPLNSENLAAAQKVEQQAMNEIRQAIQSNGRKIAAILIEPIQAEGGDRHFRPEFLRALYDLTRQEDILLIFDEVQTGIAQTGKMWAFEHFGFVPDMVAFGKRTQVCGFAATERMDTVPTNVFKVSSRINSTWGGNLIDMVRCQRYLEIIEQEDLVGNCARLGEYVLGQLQELANQHPKLLSNVRGRGLLIAFDLCDNKTRDRFVDALYEKQLLINVCGDRSLRLRPPLDLDREHADKALTIIRSVCKELK